MKNRRKIEMQKFIKKQKAQEAGITLIALVVTIIILLILAGVSISTLSGQNGLIGRSRNAVDTHQRGSVIEKAQQDLIEQQLTNAEGGSYEITKTQLETILKKYFVVPDGTDVTNPDQELIANDDNGGENVKVKISDIYSGSLSDGGTTSGGTTITTADGKTTVTITADNAKDYYGQAVDYHPAGDTTGIYRIFYYEGSSNKYGDGEGTIYLKRDWTANDTNLYSTVITGGYTETTEARARMLAMNPSYRDNSGRTETAYASLDNNEKEAIWICDESKFETYKATAGKYAEYVNYVIGSPSVEMYVDSYNSVSHTTNSYTLGTSFRDDYTNKGSSYGRGYIYTLNGAQSTISSNDYWTGTDSLDYVGYNSMYCGKEGSKGSYYWWLASPSAGNAIYVCSVNGYNAHLDGTVDYDTLGLCPLVSLKSGVQLTLK